MANIIKLFLMLYNMTMGFIVTFAIVWRLTGHEFTEWSIAVITVLSIVAEALYVLWIIEVKKDGR